MDEAPWNLAERFDTGDRLVGVEMVWLEPGDLVARLSSDVSREVAMALSERHQVFWDLLGHR
ncbi:hypothetical protein [Microlunatus soli]|uniref:hypothetical protein n=1 Tax=Microlunatus soli TaxID=630515 RepID=UPI000B8326CB|nr:hypothetical protein [Microlunatus soli]